MGEAAIVTKEIAMELIARGFALVDQKERVWYFEDSALLWASVEELVEALQEQDK